MAMSLPMPLPAPVIKQLWPENKNGFISLKDACFRQNTTGEHDVCLCQCVVKVQRKATHAYTNTYSINRYTLHDSHSSRTRQLLLSARDEVVEDIQG